MKKATWGRTKMTCNSDQGGKYVIMIHCPVLLKYVAKRSFCSPLKLKRDKGEGCDFIERM